MYIFWFPNGDLLHLGTGVPLIKSKHLYNLWHCENCHDVFLWSCTRNLGGLQLKEPLDNLTKFWYLDSQVGAPVYKTTLYIASDREKLFTEAPMYLRSTKPLYNLTTRNSRWGCIWSGTSTGAPVKIVFPEVMFFPCELRYSDWSWRIINKHNSHR